ncbi:MAG: histidine phosphatase family protein [Deltaproteobacteria bacterium]|nr:histidine phosphatase family protein [Deltaproteobacteria bacterium]
MTTLAIARHGNTFRPGEVPRRIGVSTDLPLVEKGVEQARTIGTYLRENALLPDVVYTSHLKRTIQTAEIALAEAELTAPIIRHEMFNEIDYGPDENKTEEELVARIGKKAIIDWDERAIVPLGWKVDPQKIIHDWGDFASRILRDYSKGNVLVITSNGVGRFAPHIAGNFTAFAARNAIKLATGAIGILTYSSVNGWVIDKWNEKPKERLQR